MSLRPIIYTSMSSRRLEYVCHFIFRELAETEFEISGEEPGLSENSPLISYGNHGASDAILHIQSSEGLQERTRPDRPESINWLELPEEGPWPDIFHFIFYHLSRTDEMDQDNLDRHGRIISSNTWLGRNDLTRTPVVDVVIQQLFKRINRVSSSGSLEVRKKPVSEMTIDVDQLYAYRRKPFWRYAGSFARDVLTGRWSRITDRWKTLTAVADDPYDRVSWMLKQIGDRGLTSQTFFLVGGMSRYDRQVRLTPDDLKPLARQTRIGLHPSYLAGSDQKLLIKEKHVLEALTAEEVKNSRFHYLRVDVPESYNNLIAAGISGDHTLCWSDEIGFRAGTSHSFPFYDMASETVTDLRLFPSIAMDVILKNTLGLSPEKALEEIHEVILTSREYRGEARIIWHNSSFDPTESWGNWDNVFLRILDLLTGN